MWLISVTVGANAAICFYGYGTFTQLPWWFESLSEVEACRQGCPPIMTSRCFTHYSYEYPAFLLIAVLRSNAIGRFEPAGRHRVGYSLCFINDMFAILANLE